MFFVKQGCKKQHASKEFLIQILGCHCEETRTRTSSCTLTGEKLLFPMIKRHPAILSYRLRRDLTCSGHAAQHAASRCSLASRLRFNESIRDISKGSNAIKHHTNNNDEKKCFHSGILGFRVEVKDVSACIIHCKLFYTTANDTL